MSFFENTRKPTGFGGELMVSMMNLGHNALANWGLHFLDLPKDAKILDWCCTIKVDNENSRSQYKEKCK